MEGTFGFVDLAGFVALTEAHGDDVAADVALDFAARVTGALGDTGRLVKLVGDAALIYCREPRDAVLALRRLWSGTTGLPAFRAGLHHGTAVTRGADVFGAAINIAARLAGRAAGGEVLATSLVAAAARAAGIEVVSLGEIRIRNVSTPIEVFSVHCFADQPASRIDPVCRMRVTPETVQGRLRHAGVEWWFCSLECASRFASQPDVFVAQIAEGDEPA